MKTPRDPQSLAARSPLLRFIRWLFSWHVLRRLLLGTATLVTLIALGVALENWRARRAWELYKTQGEARGEHFDLASLVTPPVPDDQNFAATPFLKPLFDVENDPVSGRQRWRDTNGFVRATTFGVWLSDSRAPLASWNETRPVDLAEWQRTLFGLTNTIRASANPVVDKVDVPPPRLPATPGDPASDILAVLDQLQPTTEEIRVALQRPASRFNLSYDGGLGTIFAHLIALRRCQQVFVLRALAELAAGRTNDAFADTEAALKLSSRLREEPFLITALVRFELLRVAIQPIWEGCRQHAWTEPQLVRLQEQLGATDLLADSYRVVRGERGFVMDFLRQMREGTLPRSDLEGITDITAPEVLLGRMTPAFFTYRSQLALAQFYDAHVLNAVDATQHRVSRKAAESFEALESSEQGVRLDALVRALMPAWNKALFRLALAQTQVDLAYTATGLERYRLAHGTYPETLEALVPAFAKNLPKDVVTGEPLHYRRSSDGYYVLYSIGWNEKDDGGVVAYRKPGKPDPQAGDWIWRLP